MPIARNYTQCRLSGFGVAYIICCNNFVAGFVLAAL